MADAEQTPLPPWVRLARAALDAATADAYPEATAHVHTLVARHGVDVMPAVLCAWVDTVIAAAGDRRDDPGLVQIAFRQEGTNTITGADAVPPSLRWAGRFFAARAADDVDQAHALIESVTSDEEWSRGVSALLIVCGTNLRELAAGRSVFHRTVIRRG